MRFKKDDAIAGESEDTGRVIIGIIRGMTDKCYRVQWLDLDPEEGESYIRFAAERHLERLIVSFAGPVSCGRG